MFKKMGMNHYSIFPESLSYCPELFNKKDQKEMNQKILNR